MERRHPGIHNPAPDFKPGEALLLALTSSGWIMWNSQFTALGQAPPSPCTVARADSSDMGVVAVLWPMKNWISLVQALRFNTHEGRDHPRKSGSPLLQSLGSTGSPLSADAYDWTTGEEDVWLAPDDFRRLWPGQGVCSGASGMPVRGRNAVSRAWQYSARAL
jgi:acetoacetyl-CoA synthetase